MTDEICVICIEKVSKPVSYKLECNHQFHSNCIYKFLTYKKTKINALSCPICRQSISNYDLYHISSMFYELFKKEFTQHSKKLNKLQRKHMFLNYKFNFKKMFTTVYLHDEQQFFIKDNKFMSEINYEKEIVYKLQKKVNESRILYLNVKHLIS